MAGPDSTAVLGNWKLHAYSVVDSTNLVAAALPPWVAVRAEAQTAGRGRFQRAWVSDSGGLWLSAVIPAPPATVLLLPLVAGLAVCEGLWDLGVKGLRLRWPNDVLVHNRKLAGLLLDQFVPGVAVVGIGVNVANAPEAGHPELKNLTTRLADLLSNPPSLEALTKILLDRLHSVVNELHSAGSASVLDRVNQLWGPARLVQLDLDGVLRRGRFAGVDSQGRLLLTLDSGDIEVFAPHQVRHLEEL